MLGFNKSCRYLFLFFCVSTIFVLGSEDHIYTPFGLYHKFCVLEVPTGTTIHHQDNGFRLTYPDGTKAEYGKCPQKLNDTPNYWQGWAKETALQLEYQLQEDLSYTSANWNIPNTPNNPSVNFASPWPAPSIFSYISIKGDMNYGLMPAAEWNAINSETWELASWSFGPSGYAIHSQALTGIYPGQIVYGNIVHNGYNIYKVTSGTSGNSVTLKVDMSGVSWRWRPHSVTTTLSSEYVTYCDQLPNNTVTFAPQIATSSGPINSISWNPQMLCNSIECPIICNGTTSVDSYGNIDIGYNPPIMCKFTEVIGYIPFGSDVFHGSYSINDAMELCSSMSNCAGFTMNLNTNVNGIYKVWGKSITNIAASNNGWVSYIKEC